MMKFFRKFKDLGMEGIQAKMYDENSRKNRLGEIKEEAKEVAKHIKDGDSVLEVATGPGYLSIELSKHGKYNITGIDVSKDCVDIAVKNAKEAGVEIDFMYGNASDMMFEANSFNFIVCILSFKNFKDPLKSLNEIYRVLKPGGTALIKDLNKNASRQSMKGLLHKMGLKGFNAFIAEVMQRSGAYTQKDFENFISQTEFKEFDIQNRDIAFSIYLYK